MNPGESGDFIGVGRVILEFDHDGGGNEGWVEGLNWKELDVIREMVMMPVGIGYFRHRSMTV